MTDELLKKTARTGDGRYEKVHAERIFPNVFSKDAPGCILNSPQRQQQDIPNNIADIMIPESRNNMFVA